MGPVVVLSDILIINYHSRFIGHLICYSAVTATLLGMLQRVLLSTYLLYVAEPTKQGMYLLKIYIIFIFCKEAELLCLEFQLLRINTRTYLVHRLIITYLLKNKNLFNN